MPNPFLISLLMSSLFDFMCTAQVRSFEFSDFIKKCAWYMLFCFFWSGQYIIAAGEIIFAMAGKFVRGLKVTIRCHFTYVTAHTLHTYFSFSC